MPERWISDLPRRSISRLAALTTPRILRRCSAACCRRSGGAVGSFSSGGSAASQPAFSQHAMAQARRTGLLSLGGAQSSAVGCPIGGVEATIAVAHHACAGIGISRRIGTTARLCRIDINAVHISGRREFALTAARISTMPGQRSPYPPCCGTLSQCPRFSTSGICQASRNASRSSRRARSTSAAGMPGIGCQ